jgi:uncharacterized coiled-coil protein SlyX
MMIRSLLLERLEDKRIRELEDRIASQEKEIQWLRKQLEEKMRDIFQLKRYYGSDD